MSGDPKLVAIARLERALKHGDAAAKSRRQTQGFGVYCDGDLAAAFRSSALSALGAVFGSSNVHYREFDARITSAQEADMKAGIAMLNVALEEIKEGWLHSLKNLVTAEVFGGLLEMAAYYIEDGHKDAAAVVAGAALESHLKKLAERAGVDITEVLKSGDVVLKRAGRLNDDLHKVGAYNALDQKQITAWQGLRNDAAHGNFERYAKEQVALMVDGITSFVARTT
jgi:hypothetical protein